MNIEIRVEVAAPELASAISKLADALASKKTVVNLTTMTPAAVNGAELQLPKGTTATVAEAMQEPQKPKSRRATKKAAEAPQKAPVEPEVPQPEEVPAPQERPAESAPEQPEAAPETVADHPAAAEIAKEAKSDPTLEQIMAAGAQFMDDNPDKLPALLNLLRDFEVQAVTQLKPDQLAGFAEKLRELGAGV